MKKLKFYAWAFAFMFAMYLPIPFALACGYKAIPICIICGFAMWKVLKILLSYNV